MKKNNLITLIPIVTAFFAMGFVDLVGTASNYVKDDFKLTDTVANLLPSMVFFWFFILAVPSGLLMNRIGRKRTVLLSLIVTLPSLLIPLIHYSVASVMVSFALLGIGNTMMQVSLNPLIATVVSSERSASTLTFGQFVKAISSFMAPILATWAATYFEDWRMLLFPLFAAVAVVVVIWLGMTKIDEPKPSTENVSVWRCLGLLSDSVVLLLFLGIMAHVGLDVGINVTAPRILIERIGLTLKDANYATGFYFIFRTT